MPNVFELIQAQIGREYKARHVYLAASIWCGAEGYEGANAYFAKQSQEEGEHAEKFLRFLSDFADIAPEIPAVEPEQPEFEDLSSVASAALQLELEVTGFIREIAVQADKEGAQEVEAFLQWFLLEQIDSVSFFRSLVRKLDRAGENEAAILAVDEFLGDLVA